MDKTPFPNRVAGPSFGNGGKTPALKLSKLALLAPPEAEADPSSPDVAPLLRPSSTRKSLRGRLSQNFKTPLTKGNHWDVSPGDMEGLDGGLVNGATPETVPVAMDMDDEIEYMPPTAIGEYVSFYGVSLGLSKPQELPYEPPFAMPDYKSMGRDLFELGHGGLVDDTADIFYAADIEDQMDVKALLSDTGFSAGNPAMRILELPKLGAFNMFEALLDVHDGTRVLPEDDSPFAPKRPAPKPAAPVVATKTAGLLSRIPTARLPNARMQPPPRPATTIPSSQPQSRASSRATTSSGAATPAPAPARAGPALVIAPGQTRTSALRAAKAAATSNHTTPPNLVRPTVASTAAPVRKPGVPPSTSSTTGARVPIRAASTATRPALATGAAASARPRSATVTGRPRPVSGVGAPTKAKGDEDPLSVMFKEHTAVDDDFCFDI